MPDELSVNPSGEISLPEQQIPPRGPRWVFFGSDGLRAGWSALLFLVMVVGFGALLSFVVKALMHGHRPDPSAPASPVRSLIGEGASMLIVLLVSWIMARIEGRRLAVYGYAGRDKLVRFLWGG
ncbi:MAG TPA: hypothetical protein VGG80_10635, partial [Acidobacteriaceae bacterium]